MTLAFYPRGGSAQVVRYLGGALRTLGHAVTVCCGSKGPPGSSSHAVTFFAGLDVQALDFTEAATWFEQGRDPMAAPVPFHPSFEDRPGVPDRVFASLDGDAYHRQVAAWQSLLERVGLPDLYHIHHLTPVNDAVAALGDRPTVVHLHGTELKMLAEIRRGGGERWKHAAEWDQRLVRAGRRADRLVVISPTDRQLAIDLLAVAPSLIEVVPNGVDIGRFVPIGLTTSQRLGQWRRWLVDEPRGWDESGEPGTIRYSNNDIERFFLDSATGELLPVLLFVGRFLDFKRVPLLVRAYATAREALGPEMRFLTRGEVETLASAAGQYRALVLTAAYTGARFGELAALRIDRLDLLRRRLTVAYSLSDVRGQWSLKAPKTAASRRQIALPRSLCDVLSGLLAVVPAGDDGFVFQAPQGGPLRRSNFRRRVWLPSVHRSVGEPMRFHDLRHTHVALLIAQGEHPKTIQVRLGHTSISTTLDTYGHLFEGLDEAAADRLDAAPAPSARPQTPGTVTQLNPETRENPR